MYLLITEIKKIKEEEKNLRILPMNLEAEQALLASLLTDNKTYEKVSDFSKEEMNDIFGIFKNYSLSASPEAFPLYHKIAESINVTLFWSQTWTVKSLASGVDIVASWFIDMFCP